MNDDVFIKIQELVAKLMEGGKDWAKYGQARDARKLLQEIKVEAARLRQEITRSHKEAKAAT